MKNERSLEQGYVSVQQNNSSENVINSNSKKEILLVSTNKIPCLHCGELISLKEDVHMCNIPRLEWLKKQHRVIIELKGGFLYDLKTKKVVGTKKNGY